MSIVKSREQWPSKNYMAAWKKFRELSDENQMIASHLIGRKNWPKTDLNVCDIGCADGLLLAKIISIMGKENVSKVILLDPDKELLNEAKNNIKAVGVTNVKNYQKYAKEINRPMLENVNAILIVHVVYLLQDNELKNLLYSVPENVPVYIVLDAPSSVFTKLWSKTSKSYFYRAAEVHRLVKNISDAKNFKVNKSQFETHINFDLLKDEDLWGPHLLTLICYCDMTKKDSPVEEVMKVLEEYKKGKDIVFDSTCYEIIRTS